MRTKARFMVPVLVRRGVNLPENLTVPPVPGISATAVDSDTIRISVTSDYPSEVQVSEDGSTWSDLTTLAANPSDYDHDIEATAEFLADTFTDTDGTLANAHESDNGITPVMLGTQTKIYSNSLAIDHTAGGGAEVMYDLDSLPEVFTIEATITTFVTNNQGHQGVSFRSDGTLRDGIGCIISNQIAYIYNFNTSSAIATAAFPYTDSTAYDFRVEVDSGDVDFYIDDALIVSATVSGWGSLTGEHMGWSGHYTAGGFANDPVCDNLEITGPSSPPFTRHYRARAVNGGIYSDWSATATETTPTP